jgi:AcrR family transcriptional regulator
MAQSEPATRPIEPLFPMPAGSPRGLAPEQIAVHQRQRLEAAMVEAVARHGYAGTTLRELVRIAGVSKSTFYDHFESKRGCFQETFHEIVAQVAQRVTAAYREDGDHRQRLAAAVGAFMELIAREPQAATLAIVESLSLGRAGLPDRERASEVFEVILRETFEASRSRRQVSPITTRVIAAGFRAVAYKRLRAGEAEALPELVDELVDWALGYQSAETAALRRARAAAAKPRPEAAEPADELGWSEPPDSPRSRSQLGQRERIVRAAAQLVVDRGFENLSIPAISATAGTSNQTFYENFDSKRDAVVEAFDLRAAEAFAAADRAFRAEDGPFEGFGAATRALLEYIAGNELFALLAFFDLQTAGPPALDRADAAINRFTAPLRNDAPGGIGGSAPGCVVEAIGGGCWFAIQHDLARGNASSLPERAPELARIALLPVAAPR